MKPIKRTLFLSLSTALCLSMLSFSATATMKSGVYQAVEPGQNGPVSVSVTIENGKISKIAIGENKETPGIGKLAVQKLPEKIIAAQSTNIDGIAGASVTSGAILKGVASCIKQAGGDPNAMQKKVDSQVAKNETLDTDLVVVGGGAAGMLAAINAKQHGVNVILLEKMDFLGGASSICGGVVVTQGSKIQKELGVKDDSPTKMAYDLIVNGHKKNDLSALTFYANNVGKAIDWAQELGVKLVKDKGFEYRAEHTTPRVVALEGGCPAYAQTLREKIAETGVKVLLGTKAEEILMKDSVPYGILAKNNDGTTYTIKARAILMSTGGFGANKEMLAGPLKNSLYYGPVSATGDGHKMLMKIGAKMQLMEDGKIYPQGIEARPGIALSTLQGNNAAYNNSGILVDHNGKRVINEKGTGKDILAIQLKQPNATLFLAMDKKSFDAFKKIAKNNGITDAQIESWLQANGKSAPIFAHGETLEEAAKNAGVNAENLKQTIARYNGFVRNGKDEDFNRPKKFMNAEFDATGPYFIVEQKPRFATTLGGVVVNDKMQVLAENGEPIPNIYAAGELANSVHGDDSAPVANIGFGITTGKAVSDEIIKALGKN